MQFYVMLLTERQTHRQMPSTTTSLAEVTRTTHVLFEQVSLVAHYILTKSDKLVSSITHW